MGRVKVTLKPIKNGNARKATLKQRRQGLMKKISDFSTICGVEAGLVVYDGAGNGEPAIWPQDTSKVQSILEKYQHQKSNIDNPPKTFGLEDFFNHRKVIIEAEIARVKKEIIDIKYPARNPCFNELTNEQLSFFIAKLSGKIEACDNRMNMLKNKHKSDQAATAFSSMQNMAHEICQSSNPSQLNSMLEISQGQLVPAAEKPLNDNSVMVDSAIQADSTKQLGDVKWDELGPLLNWIDDSTSY